MRLITYEGIEHRLSERNWKQMLRRFDANKANLNAFGYYFIPVKSICFTRDFKCIRCPLRDPHKKTNSCTYLFKNIIGEEIFAKIHMRDSGIAWNAKFDTEVRPALQKVCDVFNKAIPTDRQSHKKD